eukprot:2940617-Rhodomonas_salina.2
MVSGPPQTVPLYRAAFVPLYRRFCTFESLLWYRCAAVLIPLHRRFLYVPGMEKSTGVFSGTEKSTGVRIWY